MFLKSLVLKGFKSFADTTKLDFEPGVTVVVGPNGSGKSNLVDAIAWVLGSQSPRSVRSAKMEDVIFAGSKKRAALGRSEVSLILDNESGILPLDFSEVVISRTLFRTGESEYSINKTPCRLMDLSDLLSEGGMGQHQHIIVSQGEVDGVLNDRSEDRRMIIEEAAGILKHRKRRERAEKRLVETDMDLARLRDLLKEVSRQLEPLERQAEAARRHSELLEHLSQLRIFAAGEELKSLKQEKDFLSQKHRNLKAQETEFLEHQSILNVEIEESEARLNEFGMDLSGEVLANLESVKAKTENALDLLKHKTTSLSTENQIVRQLKETQAQRAEYEVELTDISARLTERESFQRELIQKQEEVKSREKELTELAARLLAEEKMKQEAESQHKDSTERLKELQTQTQDVSQQVNEQRELLAEREAEKNRWVSKLEALDMVQNFSGRARHPEGTQIMGDQVTVDSGYERAVASALGFAANALLVADTEAAIQVLKSMREKDRTGFLLTKSEPASSSSRFNSSAQAENLIRSKVSAKHGSIEPLLDSLLDSVYFADNWNEALQLHLDTGKTVVSLYGDKFSKDGWQLGNAGYQGETALAAAAQEAESAEAKANLSELEGLISPLSGKLKQLREKEQELLIALKTQEAQIQASEKKMQSAQDQIDELTAKKTEIEGGHAVFVSRRGEEIDSVKAQIANFAKRRQKIEVELSAIDQKISMLKEQLSPQEQMEVKEQVKEQSSLEPVEPIPDSLSSGVDKLSIISELNQFFSDALLEVDTQLADLREKRKLETEESRAVTQRLNENRRKREDVNQELSDLRQAVSRAEITFAEVSAHLENAIQNLEKDLDCTEDKAMSAVCPEIPEGESPQKRISDIEHELRLIGPVNHLALTEYENIKNRHGFLSEQMEDIKSARKELRKLMRTIDVEMANAFESAFSDIAENFETLFQIAFPGGEGKITLNNAENLLETGVDISARPGEKKIKRLSLLSGGERSLVALTFLFAVLKSRPSPFCILDEVDAALDDINLCRFLDLTKVLVDETQLLIVSHQKRTMEAADFLYGISMPTEGVTKAISERKTVSI